MEIAEWPKVAHGGLFQAHHTAEQKTVSQAWASLAWTAFPAICGGVAFVARGAVKCPAHEHKARVTSGFCEFANPYSAWWCTCLGRAQHCLNVRTRNRVARKPFAKMSFGLFAVSPVSPGPVSFQPVDEFALALSIVRLCRLPAPSAVHFLGL